MRPLQKCSISFKIKAHEDFNYRVIYAWLLWEWREKNSDQRSGIGGLGKTEVRCRRSEVGEKQKSDVGGQLSVVRRDLKAGVIGMTG
jgi:hypothetical protein